jgi:hypothetical protein
VVKHAAASIAEPNFICIVAGEDVVGAPLMVG